jgi:hypothetical protein
VLDILVQEPCAAKAGQAFLQSLLKGLQYAARDRNRQAEELRRCECQLFPDVESAKRTSEQPRGELTSSDTAPAPAPRSLRESSLTAKEASPFRNNGPITRTSYSEDNNIANDMTVDPPGPSVLVERARRIAEALFDLKRYGAVVDFLVPVLGQPQLPAAARPQTAGSALASGSRRSFPRPHASRKRRKACGHLKAKDFGACRARPVRAMRFVKTQSRSFDAARTLAITQRTYEA